MPESLDPNGQAHLTKKYLYKIGYFAHDRNALIRNSTRTG